MTRYRRRQNAEYIAQPCPHHDGKLDVTLINGEGSWCISRGAFERDYEPIPETPTPPAEVERCKVKESPTPWAPGTMLATCYPGSLLGVQKRECGRDLVEGRCPEHGEGR